MTRNWHMLRNAAALGAALLFLVAVAAQPPRGRDDGKKAEPAKEDPAVEAWVKTLAEKLTDKNEAVRNSARAAIVSIGEASLPVLKKMADGKDEAAASAAKSLIARIEGRNRFGFGGRGFPGRPDTQPDRPRGPGGNAEPGIGLFNRLIKDLDLTDKQKDKVKGIAVASEKKMRDALEKAHDGGRGDFAKIRDTMKTIQEDMLKGLKDVLTAEQFKKAEKALEGGFGSFGGSGRGPFGRGGDLPGGPRGPDRTPAPPTGPGVSSPLLLAPAVKDLDLTDKQKDKVKEVAEKHDKKVSDLFAKAAEAKTRPDFEAIGKILADSMKELKSILTADQFKKLEKAMTQPSQTDAPSRGERRPRTDF